MAIRNVSIYINNKHYDTRDSAIDGSYDHQEILSEIIEKNNLNLLSEFNLDGRLPIKIEVTNK